jgi:hypothetical protein
MAHPHDLILKSSKYHIRINWGKCFIEVLLRYDKVALILELKAMGEKT